MAMGEAGDGRSYRERDIESTLKDHEDRITMNERRWLVTKGALGMLAIMKGSDVLITELLALL